MNFTGIFRNLIPMRWQRTSRGEPLSVILLLRKPHFFSAEELRSAAERAWHVSFTGGDTSKYFVTQSGKITLLKAGPHVINLFHYSGPYVENPRENATWLPQESQRQAWNQHLYCVGLDYLNRDADAELGFCVLSKLVAEMLDGNCSAIYIPRQNTLAPNDETLYLELQKIASSRDCGVGVKPD
jgi:hypothetical protein